MSARQRFFIGGFGALMPVLVSLLAIDIGAMLDKGGNLSTGNIIGFFIRYLILFGIGGFVAYLHSDEHKPFKLFELGIAAPALLTSLITAQGLSTPRPGTGSTVSQTSWSISLIRSAHAADVNEQAERPIMLASGLLGDIVKGVSGSVYREVNAPVQKTIKRDEPTPAQAVKKEKREPEPVAAQKQQAVNIKAPPNVAPKAELLIAPDAAPGMAVQAQSSSKPVKLRVENLRRRYAYLQEQLQRTKRELRVAEHELAQQAPAAVR